MFKLATDSDKRLKLKSGGKGKKSSLHTTCWRKEVSSESCFKIFKSLAGNGNTVSPRKISQVLKSEGLFIYRDKRLATLQQIIEKSKLETGDSLSNNMEFQAFLRMMGEERDLITRGLSGSLAIQYFQEFINSVGLLYQVTKTNLKGTVASYIPELAKVNPELWGISLCSVDGQRYNFGDATAPFTFQSISKAFIYCWASELLGQTLVHKYVGHEPTNEDFNAIIVDSKGRPHNPMVNAGAIVVCGLIQSLALPHLTDSEKFDNCMKFFKRAAGGEFVGFNNMVYISERETASRNRGITYFLKANSSFPPSTDHLKALELYLQTCSLETTCESLAIMGATLANNGCCPITGENLLSKDTVKCLLSLMQSCGMYNCSGEVAHTVGLPAKSGVSGGIVVVVPGLLGIALYSPGLNEFGCSKRGLQFCKGLVRNFTFHPYDNIPSWRMNNSETIDSCKTETCAPMKLAAEGDDMGLAILMASGYQINKSDHMRRNALHVAASKGHLKTVKFLIENYPLLIKQKDLMGCTPLDDANYFEHSQVADYLESYTVNNDEEGKEKKIKTIGKVNSKLQPNLLPSQEVEFLNTGPLLHLRSSLKNTSHKELLMNPDNFKGITNN